MSISVYSSVQRPPRLSERTPLDWRDLLIGRLAKQISWVTLYEDYYDGRHPLQFATTKYREAFGALFNAFADNWCQIIVDSSVERLNVVGFQVNGSPSTDAWDIWQSNALDVQSVIAHTEAGKCGRCYLLVDPNGDDGPRITVEHPGQMIVAHDPADRRNRLAALKWWQGDDGYQYATLYLPDVVMRWESEFPTLSAGARVEWVDRADDSPSMGPNEFGVVPVIPLENKPGLLGRPHSDLEPAIPLQNAVNKICTDMIINSEYGSFPQRVITGVDVPVDEKAAEELKASQSRLWTFDKADVRATALPATDMSNFVVSIEVLIQHLAAQTRTPPHYLLAQMVNASGDALSVAEAGLVSKCRQKIKFFSDPWEEALALALSIGSSDVAAADCEAMWQNPERVSVATLTTAALQKKALGVPLPVIWLELGYTPEQIVEMEALEKSAREQELEQAALLQEAAVKASIMTTPTGGLPPAGGTTPGAAPGAPGPAGAPPAPAAPGGKL